MGRYELITTWAKKIGGPVAIIASLVASGIAMNFAANSITKKMYPEESEETKEEFVLTAWSKCELLSGRKYPPPDVLYNLICRFH